MGRMKEQAMARTDERPNGSRKPTHSARAKITPVGRGDDAPAEPFWITIGAAWTFEFRDEDGVIQNGLGVRLNSTPLNWDGSFTLMPTREG